MARVSAFSLGRLFGAICLLLSSAALYGVTAAPDLSLDPAHIELRGARYTDRSAVLETLRLDEQAAPNVFRLQTAGMADALRALPAVLDADVRIALPDRLVVELRERAPILAWQLGRRRFLIDIDGRLFAELPAGAVVEVPVVVDRRTEQGAAVGMRLAPVELDAVRVLAAVTPRQLGSRASALKLAVDDQQGFTLQPEGGAWRAVLGFYTPNLRPASLVPEQLRCLRALLAEGERRLRTVYLFPDGDRCGTYRTNASPRPSAGSPEPSESPAGSGAP